MKYKLFSLFAALLLAGAFFVSCKQEPLSTNGTNSMPMYSSSNPAHPALTWASFANSSSNLIVSDTDLSNQASLLHNPSGITFNPMWSPDGKSIAFTRYYASNLGYPDSIFAVDVSVNGHGAPVGSNLRCIVGGTGRPGFAWSSTTSMNKIAYVEGPGGRTKLYVVSASGGTPSLIYTAPSGLTLSPIGSGPTWSPDDSKLAVSRGDSMVLIFSTSTWTLTDSIKCTKGVNAVDWSRTGLNKLALRMPYSLYYCYPSTDSTPVWGGIYATQPTTWSPNNSALMYSASSKVWKFHVSDTDTTQIGGTISINGAINWKR